MKEATDYIRDHAADKIQMKPSGLKKKKKYLIKDHPSEIFSFKWFCLSLKTHC